MEDKHKPSPLAWYLRQLHAIWRGEDRGSARLCVLLGLDPTRNYGAAILRDPAFQTEHLAWVDIQGELMKLDIGLEVEAVLGIADTVPDWRLGIVRYAFNCDFQEALYALMRESWRARICRNCARHFIADKPPQMYCSTKCYGEAKGKRSLAWWRAEGSDRRKKRRKRGRQVKSSRRTKR